MKYFHYVITDEDIVHYKGEVDSVPLGFLTSESTLSGFNIHYKIEGENVTEIISEAMNEDAARRRVEEFLSSYLAIPFEPL